MSNTVISTLVAGEPISPSNGEISPWMTKNSVRGI